MISKLKKLAFGSHVMAAVVLTWVLVGVFGVYVLAEKSIDRANERRYQSILLADELRQSSDDLTRMVRTYVLTSDPAYKQHYQDILDIRNGDKPRPPHYEGIYWDLVHAHKLPVPGNTGPKVALLDQMKSAGFSAEELGKVTVAKNNSDALVAIERDAMALVESTAPDADARHMRAADMLHDARYHLAKGAIMEPIAEFYAALDRRTRQEVQQAEAQASRLRMVFIASSIGLLLVLWRSGRALRAALSTMRQLHRESERKLTALTKLYAALSECNQAIVHSTTEQELFEWICHGAMARGGMRLAWVGLIDPRRQHVDVVASSGEGLSALRELHIAPNPDNPFGKGPTGRAIQEDRPYWCQHYLTDPTTQPWHAIGVQFGWASSAALPLHRKGKVVGTFNVYADAEDAFDPQVQALLLEMTSDIDLALQNFDREAARKQADLRTADSEMRLALALKGSRDALWDWDLQNHHLYYSPRWWHMLGLEVNAYPVDAQLWRRMMHPQDLPVVETLLHNFIRGSDDSFSAECRIQHKDGHFIPMLVRAFAMRDAQGKVLRVSGTNMDLTERMRTQQMDALRSFMLERLASESNLAHILNDFVLQLEVGLKDMVGAVLLRDAETLQWSVGAAPNLSAHFGHAIQKLQGELIATPLGQHVLAGHRAMVQDIASIEGAEAFKAIARSEGVVSCWVEPIMSSSIQVLGLLTLYRRTHQPLTQHDAHLVEMAASLTALAIDRKRAEAQMKLAAAVFEQGNEVIMITDAHGNLVRVNRAFTRVTGYTEHEAIGQNPKMLSSGRQDADFYRNMWKAINANGQWQGEVWNRRKDGSVYPEWLSISRLRDAQGQVTNYLAIATDITGRKADEERIRMLADFDVLTGLPNRRLLQDRILIALGQAQRNSEPMALMFLDLDRFKNVNDSLGHHVGDALLVQAAQRLKNTLREQDTVCRLGGDEFVILCPDTDAVGAAHVANKLLEISNTRFVLEQQELAVTFSIGVALYPQDGDSFETLSMRADSAMYKVKQSGRNGFRFFTTEMQAQSDRMLQLENALSRALERDQLRLVYQPQVSLLDGRIVGVETLLRWDHPTLGPVSPGEFIPIAEDSGLILPIGEWVLRTATRQMREWVDAGLSMQQMAVNLSAVQFRQTDLTELVAGILREVGLEPHYLELELTEGVAMDDPLGAITIMDRLQAHGVCISIDDFGTGYSSLNYLKRFHIYKLKIDQSFVRDITDDPDDKAIVAAIIGLARSLGFQTIAEGVETQGQLEFLREQGCDEVQGYFFSHPVPALELAAFVKAHTTRT